MLKDIDILHFYSTILKINLYLHKKIVRIISLVPSITELLFDLGLEKELVGVTRFCIFPARARKEKTVIGGTKNLKLDKIRALKPDLIIGDQEENTKEQVEILAQEFPVWLSSIRGFDDALDMIFKIGLLTDRESLAQKLIDQIQTNFAKLKPIKPSLSVAYFIWQKPLMVAASDTFIHQMILKAGFSNAFSNQKRYPEISERALQAAQPDIIFLSSEPYPFAEKHIAYFQKMIPDAKVVLVDGTYFSWYGSRMVGAPEYFSKVLRSLSLI